MKRRENRRAADEPTPDEVIAAARAAFQTAAPGIGICNKCHQPTPKHHTCTQESTR